jgi:hypothetical protein
VAAPKLTKPVIMNVIQAAQECGVSIGEVIVEKDGTLRIVALAAMPPVPSEPQRAEPRRFGE